MFTGSVMRSLQVFIVSILFYIFLIPSSICGQTVVLIDNKEFQEDAVVAIDSLYNRNTEAAQHILSSWKEANPKHPIWNMWSAMEVWWNILEDLYDESFDEQLFEVMKEADFEAGRLLRNEPDHPDGLIIRALATGYSARHHANRERWVTSVRTARTAYNAYNRLIEVRPDLPDNEFVEGMKKYYAAYLPEEYPVVRTVSWFLPDGDREEGIKSIEYATENAIFSRAEASYFLGIILLNYEEDYNGAARHFENLAYKYPNNSYFQRLYVRTLMEMRRSSLALEYSESLLERWEKQNLPRFQELKEEIYYLMGRAELLSGNNDLALEYFKNSMQAATSLGNTDNRIYYSLSGFFAGREYERQNKKDEAIDHYKIAANQNVNSNLRQRARQRIRNL